MPYKYRRVCPRCYKPNLLFLANHLCQVHNLSSEERKSWLKSAIFSHQVTRSLSPRVQPQGLYTPHILQHGIPQYPLGMNPPFTDHPSQPQSIQPKSQKVAKIETSQCLETKPYPDLKFNHMFSMLVVGPSQCGETHFVEQVLTKSCIKYPNKKPRRIYWFFNQWQPRYTSLKSALCDEIQFTQGLPELSEDLHEINPKFNNVLVFDDLMSQAIDSPVLSKLLGDIVMRVLFYCYKTCFPRENLTQILAEMRSIWFCFAALVTENKLTLSQSGFFPKTAQTL